MKLHPLKFKPQLVSRIWGGQRLYSLKNITPSADAVGESWEVSSIKNQESVVDQGVFKGISLKELYDSRGVDLVGNRIFNAYPTEFPLLVKLIDACDDLSIQVHPNDALAQKLHHEPMGKTEMWYVMDAKENTRIIAGLSKPTNWDELMQAISHNQVEDMLTIYKAKSGDTFFLPAGCVHAIGKGSLIAEIQQSSDLTYRLYDYDRKDTLGQKRKLHLEEAMQAIDFNNLKPCLVSASDTRECSTPLVSVPQFSCHKVQVSNNYSCPIQAKDSFIIYMCTSGSGHIEDEHGERYPLNYGETIFLPANLRNTSIVPDTSMTLLEIFM